MYNLKHSNKYYIRDKRHFLDRVFNGYIRNLPLTVSMNTYENLNSSGRLKRVEYYNTKLIVRGEGVKLYKRYVSFKRYKKRTKYYRIKNKYRLKNVPLTQFCKWECQPPY